MLDALVDLAATEGIDATTVADVCRRARVSNSAFYAQFSDKGDACVAAYDQVADDVFAAIGSSIGADRPWAEFVSAAIDAYLDVFVRAPAAARLFVLESASAPPSVQRRRRERHHALADLIADLHRQASQQDPALRVAAPGVYLATVEGVAGLVADHLASHPDQPVTELRDDLIDFVTAILRGTGAVQS